MLIQVNLRLFSPKKTSLVFVLRDQTKTPLDQLKIILMKDLDQIWNSITVPETHQGKSFEDFFDVEVNFGPCLPCSPYKVFFPLPGLIFSLLPSSCW